MTLVGSDIIRILEEHLPAAHGGSALDYQLVEEEDADGFTRFHLRVSPRVQIASEAAVVQTFIEAIDQIGGRAAVSPLLKQGGTIRVDRREPEWTSRGKLMPLHVTKRLRKAAD